MSDEKQSTALVMGDGAGISISFSDLEYTALYGVRAAELAANSGRLTAFGFESLREAYGSRCSVAFGCASAAHAPYAWGMTALGYSALRYAQWSEQTVAVGLDSGRNAHHCPECIFIGTRAARDASNLVNAIAIGTDAVATGSNQTVLGNDRTERTTIKGSLITSHGRVPSDSDSPGVDGEEAFDGDYFYKHDGACWRRCEMKRFKK